MDQIFTMHYIFKQCTEWQRQLYINYVDFEKAFSSIYLESQRCILRAYGIPQQIVLVIKSLYNNLKCRVRNSESGFDVETGVRQGCPISPLLFNLTIDWAMRQTTLDQPRRIRWTFFSTLVSHTHQNIQEKTTRLSMFTQQVGLKMSKKTESTL